MSGADARLGVKRPAAQQMVQVPAGQINRTKVSTFRIDRDEVTIGNILGDKKDRVLVSGNSTHNIVRDGYKNFELWEIDRGGKPVGGMITNSDLVALLRNVEEGKRYRLRLPFDPNLKGRADWAPADANAPDQVYLNLPATGITFGDANQYCKDRGDGFRLPTADEFELAGRGGLKGRVFFATRDGKYNGKDVYVNGTSPRPVDHGTNGNGLGIRNLSGNVADWVRNGAKSLFIGPHFDALRTSDVGPAALEEGWLLGHVHTSLSAEDPSSYIGFRCMQEEDASAKSAKRSFKPRKH